MSTSVWPGARTYQLAVGLLELGIAGTAAHAEDRIVILALHSTQESDVSAQRLMHRRGGKAVVCPATALTHTAGSQRCAGAREAALSGK